jgi:hypothetical protein
MHDQPCRLVTTLGDTLIGLEVHNELRLLVGGSPRRLRLSLALVFGISSGYREVNVVPISVDGDVVQGTSAVTLVTIIMVILMAITVKI